MCAVSIIALIPIILIIIGDQQTQAKVFGRCEAAMELQRSGRISRSLISNWICLMDSESGLNTQKVSGPKIQSSYNYGVFQISSRQWCTRGRPGGRCNKRCEDFADDNIQDDIICAQMIFNSLGFNGWEGWKNKCKNKQLPNISDCRR